MTFFFIDYEIENLKILQENIWKKLFGSRLWMIISYYGKDTSIIQDILMIS